MEVETIKERPIAEGPPNKSAGRVPEWSAEVLIARGPEVPGGVLGVRKTHERAIYFSRKSCRLKGRFPLPSSCARRGGVYKKGQVSRGDFFESSGNRRRLRENGGRPARKDSSVKWGISRRVQKRPYGKITSAKHRRTSRGSSKTLVQRSKTRRKKKKVQAEKKTKK